MEVERQNSQVATIPNKEVVLAPNKEVAMVAQKDVCYKSLFFYVDSKHSFRSETEQLLIF